MMRRTRVGGRRSLPSKGQRILFAAAGAVALVIAVAIASTQPARPGGGEAIIPLEDRCSNSPVPTVAEPSGSVNGQPTIAGAIEPGVVLVQIQCGRDINAIVAKYRLKGPARRYLQVPVTQHNIDIGATRWYLVAVVSGTEGTTVVALSGHPDDIAFVQLFPDQSRRGVPENSFVAVASPSPARTSGPGPIPTPTPSMLRASGVPGIATAPVGEMHGGWAIALKHSTLSDDEVWATPLDGSRPPVLAVTLFHLLSPLSGGLPRGVELRWIFSADGRQIVVAGSDDSIVMVDLPSGTPRALGVTGGAPILTRDGRWIVFGRVAGLDKPEGEQTHSLWVVPVSGDGGPRQIPGAYVQGLGGESRLVVQASDTSTDAALVDAASGARIGDFPTTAGTVPGTMAWRAGSPAFAFITDEWQVPGGGSPYDVTRIEVMNNDLSSRRVLLQREGSFYTTRFDQVRWNPVRDEVLFGEVTPDAEGFQYGILNVATVAVQRIPVTFRDTRVLTWDRDGEDLVGLVRDVANTPPVPAALPSNLVPWYGRYALAVIGRDGSIHRMFSAISELNPYDRIWDVVTISY